MIIFRWTTAATFFVILPVSCDYCGIMWHMYMQLVHDRTAYTIGPCVQKQIINIVTLYGKVTHVWCYAYVHASTGYLGVSGLCCTYIRAMLRGYSF